MRLMRVLLIVGGGALALLLVISLPFIIGGAILGGWNQDDSPSEVKPPAPISKPAPLAVQPGHPAAATLANYAKPETSPRDDLRAVASMLDTFRLLAKGNALPLGSNEEISAALRGETRAKLTLLPRDHPAFDKAGRIVDRWGTPLFFHAQSAKEIEVRSAGPDREFDTADDITFGAR